MESNQINTDPIQFEDERKAKKIEKLKKQEISSEIKTENSKNLIKYEEGLTNSVDSIENKKDISANKEKPLEQNCNINNPQVTKEDLKPSNKLVKENEKSIKFNSKREKMNDRDDSNKKLKVVEDQITELEKEIEDLDNLLE